MAPQTAVKYHLTVPAQVTPHVCPTHSDVPIFALGVIVSLLVLRTVAEVKRRLALPKTRKYVFANNDRSEVWTVRAANAKEACEKSKCHGWVWVDATGEALGWSESILQLPGLGHAVVDPPVQPQRDLDEMLKAAGAGPKSLLAEFQ